MRSDFVRAPRQVMFSCYFLDFQQKLDTECGETSFTTGPDLSAGQNLEIWCQSKSLGMKRDLPLLSSPAFSNSLDSSDTRVQC